MDRKLSTYYADDDSGSYVEVHYNFKDELAFLEYFNVDGKKFFHEEFPNNTIRYAEDAAENWALGIKKIETLYG
jgi:hypothetical protein